MTNASPGWFPDTTQAGRLRWWDGTVWTEHYHDPSAPAPPPGPPPTPPKRRGRRPGPPLTISIVMIVVGFVFVTAASLSAAIPFLRTVSSSDKMSVPGRARFHLSPGDYLIYERTGIADSGSNEAVSIDAGAVRITGPGETPVEVSQDSGATETITQNDQEYTGAVDFTITRTGDYNIEVRDARPGRALVARSLSATLRRAVPWIVIGAIAGLVLLAGIIMTIVASIRRYRWNQGR